MSLNRKDEIGRLPAVPRSKGCINCTARKTRCDGRRPACKACERRAHVCRGYRRDDFVFMNEGWRAPGVASSRQSTTKPKQQQTLPKQINPDPVSIYVSFFLAQFTRNPPPQALVMVSSCHQYLGRLVSRTSATYHTDPLADAAEALVTQHFGKLNSDSHIVHESIKPYIRALRSLSARLSHVQCVGIGSLPEEEVIQLVFSCLFLALWELAMSPQDTTWQRHVRGLSNVIKWRGASGFRSPKGFQVITILRLFILLESISSRQPTFLSDTEWQGFRFFQPRSLPSCPDANSALSSDESANIGPRHLLDFVFDRLIIVASLSSEFSQLLDCSFGDFGSDIKLERMRNKSITVVNELERALAQVETNIGAQLKPVRTAARASPTQFHQKGPSWGKPLEYNLTCLCRTAAVTLRLLLCDLIQEEMSRGRTDCAGNLAQHQAALMRHVEATLNAIPYSSSKEIFGVAPLCFVPAFRIAKVVLAKRGALTLSADENEEEAQKCARMSERIQEHLDFVSSKKIAVGIVL